MASIFTRWLYPIVTKTPGSEFRAKLSDDHDVDGVELAGFSTPTATELDPLHNKHINRVYLNGAIDNAPAEQTDHLSVKPDSSKPKHPLAASHANGEGLNDNASNISVVNIQGITGDGGHITTTAIQQTTGVSSQQQLRSHWHTSAPDIRLVVSVLLELAADQQSAAQLHELLNSSSWEDACKQCRDGLLLRSVLHHYFPDTIDSILDANSLETQAANQHSSSSNSKSRGSLANQQQFQDPLQQLQASIQHQQRQPQHPPSHDHQQQQLWHDTASEFLAAASAVGVQVPQGCSPASIAAGQPDVLLQLLLEVVVAGEAQHQLQGQCLVVLQQLQQQQQQEGQQLTGAVVQDQMHSTAVAGDLAANVWPLVQTWTANVVQQCAGLQQVQLGNVHGQQQRRRKQKAKECASAADVTWQRLLASLQALHEQHTVNGCEQQQQQQGQQQTSVAAGGAVSTAQHHPSDDAMQGISSSSRLSSAKHPELLQLQELGCDLALLQQQDLADAVLQGQLCPDALQLVVLLRLLGHTTSLWLPSAMVAAAGNPVVAELGLDHRSDLQPQQALVGDADVSSAEASSTGSPAAAAAQAADGGQQVGRDGCNSKSNDVLTSPRSFWPPDLLTHSQLWPGDENEADAAVMSREERTLRCWINSLLHKSERGSSNTAAAGSSSEEASAALHDSADVNSLSLQDTAAAGFATPAARGATAAPGRVAANGPANSMDLSPEQQHPAVGVLDTSNSSSTTSAAPADAATTATSYHFSFRSISSLFGAEVRSGVLLLELLEYLQPGCVDWKVANRLPFKGMGMSAQLQALENCQLALKIAQENLGLPLVSMSPRDVVLGRRKIILSLVYQLMRYHTMQLLESIAAVQQRQQSSSGGVHSSSGGQQVGQLSAGGSSLQGGSGAVAETAELPEESPSVTQRPSGVVRICSSSRKQRKGGQLGITEDAILAWANARLQQVQPLLREATGAAAAGDAASDSGCSAPCIKSFRDSVLSSGVVLLQLLYAMKPDAVDLSYVTPGFTLEQRQSNAKYALSVADKMGCSLFLVWEDLLDLHPKLVLVLLASLMYLDYTMV